MPPGAEYEFGEAENVVFRYAAWNLRVGGWGVLALVVLYHAVLLAGWGLGGRPPYERFALGDLVWPLVVAWFGVSFVRAGRSFHRVAVTRGSDVAHLMGGLSRLNAVFGVLPFGWVVVLGVGVMVLAAAVARVLGH